MKKYYVYTIDEKSTEEFIIDTFESLEEAREAAKSEKYYIERDGRKAEHVEIRQYVEDIEEPECTSFDYNTFTF